MPTPLKSPRIEVLRASLFAYVTRRKQQNQPSRNQNQRHQRYAYEKETPEIRNRERLRHCNAHNEKKRSKKLNLRKKNPLINRIKNGMIVAHTFHTFKLIITLLI